MKRILFDAHAILKWTQKEKGYQKVKALLVECRNQSVLGEPLAKVSRKHIEKSFPEELESISCRVFNLSSFGSHLKDGFLSAWHIGLPLSTFFFAL